MAEKFPYNIAGKLLMKLSSPALQEIKLQWGSGAEAEFEKLKGILSTIQPVLLDAEQKQATNSRIREWLKTLKVALYEADDLLNDFTKVSTQIKVVSQNKACIFFSRSKQILLHLKMVHKVKVIREKLAAMAPDRIYFYLDEPQDETLVENKRRETHSFVRVEKIIGREEDRKAILELLINSNVEQNLLIVPIVGAGGLGKTALAQLVYNDESVKKHFELTMWVCVSDVLDVKHIPQKIIESATCKKIGSVLTDLDDIFGLIHQIVGKRYFLVLDDVCNEDPHGWSVLREWLMCAGRDSKILVTTRSPFVAELTHSVSPYPLKALSESDSWSLFKQMAFKDKVEADNPRIAIGQEIVKKCAGVPLTIRTIGSLLYSRYTEREWLYLKNTELPEIIQGSKGTAPVHSSGFGRSTQ